MHYDIDRDLSLFKTCLFSSYLVKFVVVDFFELENNRLIKSYKIFYIFGDYYCIDSSVNKWSNTS